MTLAVENPRPSPKNLTSLKDILAALSSLENEELQVSLCLTELLMTRDPIETALSNLKSLSSQFGEVKVDAALLEEKVSSTAHTANRVGGRVQSLDERMRRVREASERVNQVIELKSSLNSLQFAIAAQDWEAATRLCARAMSLPDDVIAGSFAEKAVPSGELPLPPVQSLQSTRELLRDTFLKQFREAVRSRDAAMITRFFKLFSPIGWEVEGLDAYASFAVDLIHTKAPTSVKTSSPLYYVTALTSLFESVCNIVDQHQPVVEKYYGRYKMLHVVRSLVRECDVSAEGLVSAWKEERCIERMRSEVNSIAPASQAPPASGGKNLVSLSLVEEDGPDPREVDKLLNELSALGLRYAVFRRFISMNFEEKILERNDNLLIPTNVQQDPSVPRQSGGTDIMNKCKCDLLIGKLLADYYIPLEVWYMKTTIMKAHRTASIDLTQVPPTSSVPDLVFYILQAVVCRTLNTGSVQVVEGIRRRLLDILKFDYADVIKRKLDDVYRTAGSTNVAGSGKEDKEARLNFVVLLNDLHVSTSHLDRLIKDVLASNLAEQNFMSSEVETVKRAISSLQELAAKLQSTLKYSVEQLHNQLLRPRLRTFITDIYKDISYVIDEDSYTLSEAQDLVRKRFVKLWGDLMAGFKESMADSNYQILFSLTLDAVLRPWEKFVTSLRYTELGAIRFDHDIRSVVTYLSGHVTFGDVREKFLRLQQISTLLNIDKDENLDDFYSSSGITWKLTAADARAIVGLKVT